LTRTNALVVGLFQKFFAEGDQVSRSASQEAPARSSGLAAELNSSGWRKPCAEAYPAPALLARFYEYGVPITTTADGHHLDDVAWRVSDLTKMARAAGYDEVSAFRARKRTPFPL
jgi:histidinol-phosphatase (PHP family)